MAVFIGGIRKYKSSKLQGYDVFFYHKRNDEIESSFVEAYSEKEAIELATLKHRITYPRVRFEFYKIKKYK
jgi:hypothetical protein